jgi:hypothetical protein
MNKRVYMDFDTERRVESLFEHMVLLGLWSEPR